MIKVLYLEDEVFLGRIVTESLSSRGYDIRLVSDGAVFMENYDDFKPHICVLDIMVPNKDGYTIASELKERKDGIPIIFLSAKVQTEDVIKGFRSGGNDYMKKPFSMEELIVRIESLVSLSRQKEDDTQEVFHLGAYTYDYTAMTLTYREESPIQLSHRENELLLLCCKSQNQQLNRKDILDKLWGDDSIYNSRNLDVYARKLRVYLEKDPSIQLITLRGVGYKFIVEE